MIETDDSTHIGLSNIETMLQKMKGKCLIQKNNEKFSISLCFPYCLFGGGSDLPAINSKISIVKSIAQVE